MTLVFATCLCLAVAGPAERPCVIVVVGAAGQPEYAAQFRTWADHWQTAAKKGSAEFLRIGLDEPKESTGPASNHDAGGVSDRERLRLALAEKSAPAAEPLWLVLIGHGTFDGREAKFNLRGPDVGEAELAEWLARLQRPVAVLDCASASGPFLNRLSGENRVVVTATRSGHEQNFARFGQYLAEAIADPRADLDKDGQTSLLEAYLTASSRLAEFYKSRAQLATEHPLIDDNGDKLGTPPDWFHGIHATKRAKDGAPLDGIRAHQLHLVLSDREKEMPADLRQRRDRLERAIASLRDEKGKLSEDAYYGRLESLMVELARLYRERPAGQADRSGR